jgi:CRP-like cAMP-binding protein
MGCIGPGCGRITGSVCDEIAIATTNGERQTAKSSLAFCHFAAASMTWRLSRRLLPDYLPSRARRQGLSRHRQAVLVYPNTDSDVLVWRPAITIRNMLTGIDAHSRSFIASQPWFATLGAGDQSQVLADITVMQARKGEIPLPQGEPVGGWYAVLSGLVMLESGAKGRRRSAFLGVPDGEWFGEGSALKQELRRYDVLALRDTWLLCLPMARFTALRCQSLAFNHYLVEHLNRRLGQAMTLIETSRMRSPDHRVALYLSRLFWRSTRHLHLTQEELGHLVGLSRQTVNRVLKGLAESGIVSLDLARVQILDDDALQRYLGSE